MQPWKNRKITQHQYQRCSASVILIINANVATLTITQQKHNIGFSNTRLLVGLCQQSQKFVLLQQNKVLEQFIHHRSTPAVHRQASARDNLHAAIHGPSSRIAVGASWSPLAVRLLRLIWFLVWSWPPVHKAARRHSGDAGYKKADAAAALSQWVSPSCLPGVTNCRAIGFRFTVVKLAFMSMTV